MLRKRVAKKIVHGDGIGKKIVHITIPDPPPPKKLIGRLLSVFLAGVFALIIENMAPSFIESLK